MSRPSRPQPGCCELADRNLEWFVQAGQGGAWHPGSFQRDPERDVPSSPALDRCPFCGAALEAVGR